MIKSIKVRVVALYIVLVFIVMTVAGTTMLVKVKNNEVDTWKSSLSEAVDITIENVINISETPEQIRTNLKEVFSDTNNKFPLVTRDIEIFILSPKGNSYASTAGDIYPITISRLIVLAMDGEESFDYGNKIIDSNGNVKTWTEYAHPVKDNSGNITYIVYTRVSSEQLLNSLSLMVNTILISSLLALVLTGIIGSLFADTLTKPILRVTKGAKEFASGNLSKEILVSSNDEIGQLSESFNNMAKELSAIISFNESERNKLEILLHNMTDGVLAYDSNKNLIHANSVSFELLNLNKEDIKSFSKLEEMFNINLEQINSLQEKKELTLEIEDKFISAIFSTYSNKNKNIEGVIVVLQDITKHKKLDNMRKEFVANVSHEIRTPLTTIKGYTETLLDGAIDDREIAMNFLNIIESEADRITVLAKDLLELSQFDNSQFKLNLSKVNLISLIKETIIQNKLYAKEKNQEIIFDSKNSDILIYCDKSRIGQVLTNIVSNAIKYSVNKGIIKIWIEEANNNFLVYIKDSGLGIPEKDLEHIFERFYRVDKARSRLMGGTGLGLSIAREIMTMHNGSIVATSKIDIGTTVILSFNKDFSINNLLDDSKINVM